MTTPTHECHRDFNRANFILLNNHQLFTAKQVADLIQQHTRPHTPAPKIPNSTELTQLAINDWHNREERKHRYELQPWVNGWITGFLTESKPYWSKVREAAIRKAKREKVLDAVQDHNDGRLEGMENLFATPSNERTESAQDIYLKEAYFELTLVKHLIESLRREL